MRKANILLHFFIISTWISCTPGFTPSDTHKTDTHKKVEFEQRLEEIANYVFCTERKYVKYIKTDTVYIPVKSVELHAIKLTGEVYRRIEMMNELIDSRDCYENKCCELLIEIENHYFEHQERYNNLSTCFFIDTEINPDTARSELDIYQRTIVVHKGERVQVLRGIKKELYKIRDKTQEEKALDRYYTYLRDTKKSLRMIRQRLKHKYPHRDWEGEADAREEKFKADARDRKIERAIARGLDVKL